MKILAISSSPSRKRNSDTMLDFFISGMKQVDDIEIEKIYLGDIPIDTYNYTNGKSGAGAHEVEFKKLAEKILVVQGLVISTPTYNFSVPAHLKNFIDRSSSFALDYKNKNYLGQPKGKLGHLKTYFLVSGGTPTWAQKITFFAFPPFWLRGVFLYFGSKVMGAFYSGDIKTFENKKILNKCQKKGKRFAKKVLHGRRQGVLECIFWAPPQYKSH